MTMCSAGPDIEFAGMAMCSAGPDIEPGLEFSFFFFAGSGVQNFRLVEYII